MTKRINGKVNFIPPKGAPELATNYFPIKCGEHVVVGDIIQIKEHVRQRQKDQLVRTMIAAVVEYKVSAESLEESVVLIVCFCDWSVGNRHASGCKIKMKVSQLKKALEIRRMCWKDEEAREAVEDDQERQMESAEYELEVSHDEEEEDSDLDDEEQDSDFDASDPIPNTPLM